MARLKVSTPRSESEVPALDGGHRARQHRERSYGTSVAAAGGDRHIRRALGDAAVQRPTTTARPLRQRVVVRPPSFVPASNDRLDITATGRAIYAALRGALREAPTTRLALKSFNEHATPNSSTVDTTRPTMSPIEKHMGLTEADLAREMGRVPALFKFVTGQECTELRSDIIPLDRFVLGHARGP